VIIKAGNYHGSLERQALSVNEMSFSGGYAEGECESGSHLLIVNA
jgi:hypothetical protein